MSDAANLGLEVLQLVSPILLAALGWVSVKLGGWIKAKTKNEMVGGMLERLVHSSFAVVKRVEQKMVAEIKAAKDPNSPGGTKLTDAEKQKVFDSALAELKSMWGAKGLKELSGVLGAGEELIDKLLETHLEAALHDIKKTKEDSAGNP